MIFGRGDILLSPIDDSLAGALWGGCVVVALLSGALLARVPARLPEPAREPTGSGA
jgi:hypothetical protein